MAAGAQILACPAFVAGVETSSWFATVSGLWLGNGDGAEKSLKTAGAGRMSSGLKEELKKEEGETQMRSGQREGSMACITDSQAAATEQCGFYSWLCIRRCSRCSAEVVLLGRGRSMGGELSR
jgi:hypothetical protein